MLARPHFKCFNAVKKKPMRIKISYKLVAINIGIIVVLTSLCTYWFSRSSHSMFGGAVNGIDLEVMEHLSSALSQHYLEYGSWNTFVSNKSAWDETVNSSFFSIFFALVEKAKSKADQSHAEPIHPPEFNVAPGSQWDFPFGTFLQRVSLLDAQRQYLIKAEILKDDLNYQSIEFEGKVIGWLNVGKINLDNLPLGEYFFKQQMAALYWVMVFGGLIASLLSFILSRYITSPIGKLIHGANEIAKHNYQFKLSIKSNDELGVLAHRLNFLASKLDRYENQKKQWLMDISHELRTPLSILISETSAICDKLTKCEISAIEIIRQDLIQMKRLVDDLHDLSKIDELGFKFHKEELDLRALLVKQINYYENIFSQKGIALHCELSVAPLAILGDHDRIVQAVRILFENCLRYVASPGEIWVRCHRNAGEVFMMIEDSGPGVPDESLDKLFDRLYRIDSARSRAHGGAGLGLAICKEIFVAHDATVSASRSAKGGLCIQILFNLTEKES